MPSKGIKRMPDSKEDSLSTNYKIIRQIGEGSFSKIFEVSRPNSEIQCLKVVKQDDGRGIPAEILREISMLTHLRSAWVVRVIEVSEDAEKRNILVFFERMETDLEKFCRRRRLQDYELKTLFRNLLLGVDYIHGKGVVHRDLKPSNIFVESSTLSVKIGDMGFAFRVNLDCEDVESVIAGTLPYLAIEQICRKVYFSYETDIWSLGCIFAELAAGRPLFHECTFEKMLAAQTGFLDACFGLGWNIDYPLSTEVKPQQFTTEDWTALNLSELGTDLLRRMMHPQPRERWRASSLLSHSFFK